MPQPPEDQPVVPRRFRWLDALAVAGVLGAAALIGAGNLEAKAPVTLLNVSYDPTRELYRDLNAEFVRHWERAHAERITVRQSHGGSSRQARLVASGELVADVVTLGLPSDIEVLRKRGLVEPAWATRLPNASQPYSSTIVFVVRRGNPLGIRDWPDLVKPGVEVITPDPKASGNGKLSVLAAWGAITTRGGSDDDALAYVKALFERAPFLVPAARAAGIAFAVEKIGDVQLAWENEALREVAESKGELQIVYPPVSLRAQPSVAWVDRNVKARRTDGPAREYLQFLWTPEAQEHIARNGYRPADPQVLQRHAERLPPIALFDITAIARDWDDAQQRFFADNGLIDTVYVPKPR